MICTKVCLMSAPTVHLPSNCHRLMCSAEDWAEGGNADDELWNEVEPENDPPHEAAVYAE